MFLCLTYNRCFFCKLLKWNFGTMAVGVSSFYLVWVPTDARQQQNCISWMDNFPCMTSYDILWHYGCFNADLRATAPPISHRSALWSEDPLVAMHGKIQTCTSQKKNILAHDGWIGESVFRTTSLLLPLYPENYSVFQGNRSVSWKFMKMALRFPFSRSFSWFLSPL